MMRFSRPALGAMALALSFFACARHQTVPLSQRPQIQGTWVLNAQESASPDVDRSDIGDMRRGPGAAGVPGGRGGRGGRGGIGGRGGRGGQAGEVGGAGGQVIETMRWATQHLRTISGRIDLRLTDSTVAVAYADTTTLTLPTNGKEQKLTWRRVGEMEVKASWEEAGLQIERKLEGGIKIKETFARAPDSPRLIVDVVVDGPLRDLKFKQIYDFEPPKPD